MCPVLLMAAGAGMNFGGSALAAYGAWRQGKYQKDMARYQAGLQRQRAAQAQKSAEFEAAQAEKRNKQVIGAGLAAFAANGLLLEGRAGSAPAEWETGQEVEMALEKERIRSEAELSAWGFQANASALLAEGSNAAWAGRMAAVGSLLGGAGSALSMGSMAYGSGASGAGAGSSKYMSGSNPTGGFSSVPRSAGIA